MVCQLSNGMWAVVRYVGSCVVCGLLYGLWAVVWCVGCCICGLLYEICLL